MKNRTAFLALLLLPTSPALWSQEGTPESNAVAAESGNSSHTETIPALRDVFKDDFLIGVAINRSVTMGAAFRRSAEDIEKDSELTKRQFNHIVAENDMKWEGIHPRPGADGYTFGPADAFVEFGEKNNMHMAGHTLVWHSQTPNWVFEGTHTPEVSEGGEEVKAMPGYEALTINPPRPFPPRPATGGPGTPGGGAPAQGAAPSGPNSPPGAGQPNRPRGPGRFGPGPGFQRFDLNGPRASREELLERMRSHIHEVVGRYKGKIKVWDVVNEALADNGPEVLRRTPWSVIIGPDFVAKAFEYAHEADPEAVLRYNDYGLENPDKRRRLIALIKTLQEQKVPVMAIGTQAHCNLSTSFDVMDQSLAEIGTLGLPIHVTELDVNTADRGQQATTADLDASAMITQGGVVSDADRRLSEVYAGLFRAFVKHKDKVEIVTFWGVNDEVSWRAQGKPLLFTGQNQPKPAFEAVISIEK